MVVAWFKKKIDINTFVEEEIIPLAKEVGLSLRKKKNKVKK